MPNDAIDLFSQRLPKKPYHTDSLSSGLRVINRSIAVKSRYIQPNGPTHKFFLVFDVDREGSAIDWSDRKVPAPNITAMNRENGHSHLIYCLDTSLRTAPDGSLKALKYAAAIESSIRRALGADSAYAGLICKNPLNAHWQVMVWEENSYTFDWLADCVDMTAANASQIDPAYGLGRNCTLFEKTRQWSYRAIRQGYPDYPQWLNATIQRVEAYNLQLPVPLSSVECRSIGKSVAKWTYQRFTERGWLDWVAKTHSSEIQALRGKKGGKISKRKPSLDSERTIKPWIDLGISQRTYYRRKKKSDIDSLF